MTSTELQLIPRAFVSYKSANKGFARRLAADLRRLGVFTWLDDWNMPPGKPLTDAMQDGIAGADVMLLLLSQDSVKAIHAGTGGVAFEVHIGEGRKFRDTNFRIIGIYLEDCDPPEKLKNRIGRWIDFTNPDSYEAALSDLAAWIKDPNTDLGPPVKHTVFGASFQRLIRISPDGVLTATSNRDGSIDIRRSESKNLVLTVRAGRPPVNDMQFSPDGLTLYATDDEKTYEWQLDRPMLAAEVESEINESSLGPQAAAELYYARGLKYHEAKQYDHAIEVFTRAIQLDPKRAKYFIARGQSYGDKGMIVESIENETTAITLEPQNGYYYWLRGNSYTISGQDSLAKSDYDRAISLDPNRADFLVDRAWCKFRLDEFGVTDDLNKAIQLKTTASNYYSIGRLYMKLDRHAADAHSAFSKAIALDSSRSEYYFQRGIASDEWGYKEQAIYDFGRAIELDPKNETYYDWRAGTFYEIDHFKAAEIDGSRLIELNPNNGDGYYWRGKARLAMAGRIEIRQKKAKLDLERALALGVSAAADALKKR